MSVEMEEPRTQKKKAVSSPATTAVNTDYLALLFLSLTSIIVRCYSLSTPGEVVFDEVHFGKFAGKYINGTYFYDLHPPLAKMMFAAAGYLSGYDGKFDFQAIGLDYNAAQVPYVGMRLMPAFLGALTVPATYWTVRSCGYRWETAGLASLLVCFENGLTTQSRLILLDSPLVFFTVMALMSWCVFFTKPQFSVGWHGWLMATGVMMGCAASCKWVGLFLFPVIGLSTVCDLWDKIADRRLTPLRWCQHFLVRALALLLVPFAVYVFWFQVHFSILQRDGPGSIMFTTEFQTSLRGGLNVTANRDIYYGSEIRMRSTNALGGYLHSHAHYWQHEKGSKQQQVTIYGHADGNNLWVIEPGFNRTVDGMANGTFTQLVPVRSGDVVRLRHKITDRYLHSHNHRPAMSNEDHKFELSGYGHKNFSGDTNDDFRLDILDGPKALESIDSKFRLIHNNIQCAVFNSRRKLPKWAFEQMEVNCMRNCRPRMSTWHVEYAQHPQQANMTDLRQSRYRPLGVWGKIKEYNQRMAESNEKLTGDHPFAAFPQDWPWLRRGTGYWGGLGRLIYQLGNPIVWWGSFASVLLFILLRSVLVLLDKRRVHWEMSGQRQKYLGAAGFFTLAWAGHYLPFFLMGRELFIHHYFPALWMSTLVMAFSVDLVTIRLPPLIRRSVYVAVLAAALYAFHTFSHITYARTWTKEACLRSMWLKTWDFDCEHALGGAKATKAVTKTTTPALTDDNIKPPKVEKKQDTEAPVPEEVADTKPSAKSDDKEDSSPEQQGKVIEDTNPSAVHVEPVFDPPPVGQQAGQQASR